MEERNPLNYNYQGTVDERGGFSTIPDDFVPEETKKSSRKQLVKHIESVEIIPLNDVNIS